MPLMNMDWVKVPGKQTLIGELYDPQLMPWPELLVCILLIVYGLRLAGYLLIREINSSAYRKLLNPEIERRKYKFLVA